MTDKWCLIFLGVQTLLWGAWGGVIAWQFCCCGKYLGYTGVSDQKFAL
jgi:hypothetical protein